RGAGPRGGACLDNSQRSSIAFRAMSVMLAVVHNNEMTVGIWGDVALYDGARLAGDGAEDR
ncbi:hypothetical protein, partial [Rhodoplanes elegans]|uniref:hypothetical protein n=1 Tax=Rhodoplanes elegans TaxID=29408 RepID=UPI001A9269CE